MGTIVALHARTAEPDSDTRGCPDADLLGVFGIVWLFAVARTALAFVWHETFGVETTLALAAVVALPLTMRRSLLWLVHPPRPVVHEELAEARRLRAQPR